MQSELQAIENGRDPKQTVLSTIERSKRADAYHLMGTRRILGGMNALIEIKQDENLIAYQKNLIDAIIKSAIPSSQLQSDKAYKDEYLGWLSLKKNGEYMQEVALSEAYSFLYIAEFLYILKESNWIAKSAANKNWWNDTLGFLEKNIWEKWIKRSGSKYGNKYGYFLRSRTHMGSHWAGVAMYLERISSNDQLKAEANEVYTSYNKLLRRNIKTVGERYVWNSTYDDVSGTDAIAARQASIQDVSHGNHVVTYILNAYEMGDVNWTRNDIEYLCGTFKNAVYSPKAKSFNTYVDGSTKSKDRSRFFLGDGWVKLAKYDDEILSLCKSYTSDAEMMRNSHQEFQFNSNLLRAKSSK